MASNGNHQSAKNIFSRHPNGGVAEALNASVRQDKTARQRGSPASPQPEPLPNPAQSHPLNNKTDRAQKHGITKRKTVHLVLWVKPIIKVELQRIAQQEGLSMSATGAALPQLFPLPELTAIFPTLIPHSNGQLHGFITPDSLQ
jgi:hypothetical protein